MKSKAERLAYLEGMRNALTKYRKRRECGISEENALTQLDELIKIMEEVA